MTKVFFTLLICIAASTGFAQVVPKWKLADLEGTIKNADKPTIINFWATFCKPCIEELPYFQEAAKRYDSAGVQLILVSLDLKEVYGAKLNKFIDKLKITAPVKWLDETNADLFCPVVDPKWSGAIPATLFINNATGYRAFHEEQLTKDQLEKEIQKLIAPK